MAYIRRLNKYNNLVLRIPGLKPIIIQFMECKEKDASLKIELDPCIKTEKVPNELHRDYKEPA